MNKSRRQVLVGSAAWVSAGWAGLVQAQTSAANRTGTRLVDAVEAVEEPIYVFVGDTDARVGY